MAFSLQILFAISIGTALVMLAAAVFLRHRRRARTAALILLTLVPAVIMSRGGDWPVGRSYVFVVPPGGDATVARLAAKVPPTAAVGLVRLDPPGLSEEALPVAWTTAAELAAGGGRSDVPPVLSATPGWLRRLATVTAPDWATRLRHGFAQPTVVIATDGDFWTGVDAGTVDVTLDRAEFEGSGQHLLAVDTSASALAAGRLEVAINGRVVPALEPDGTADLSSMSVAADIRLVGCRSDSSDGTYTLRAWIDRKLATAGTERVALLSLPPDKQLLRGHRVPVPSGPLVRLGAKPEDARETRVKFADLVGVQKADSRLPQGFHRLDVELSFEAAGSTGRFRVAYAASVYFEVVSRTLIVVDASIQDDAVRPTWANRLQDGTPVVVPVVRDLIRMAVESPKKRYQSGNNYRLPFTRVKAFTAADFADPTVRKRFDEELPQAAMLLVSEPNWDTVQQLDAAVTKYVSEGGAVLTVVPSAPPPGASVPAWLPAVGQALTGTKRGADEWSEPRVYFVPDHSRPATQFHAFNGTMTGGRLQAEVINELYDQFAVTNRDGDRIENPIERSDDGCMSATDPGSRVNYFKLGGRTVLVVPPIFLGADDSAGRLNKVRQVPEMNARIEADVSASWIAARLWSLTEAERQKLLAVLAPSPATADGMQLPPHEFDAPLRLPHFHRRSVVVVFALQINQPPPATAPPTWKDLDGKAWIRRGQMVDVDKTVEMVDPKKLTEAGVRILVVPIRLHPKLAQSFSVKTGIPIGDAVNEFGAKSMPPLDLSDSNATAQNSVAAVVDAVRQEIVAAISSGPQLKVAEAGRAVTLRMEAVEGPRVWRRLVPPPGAKAWPREAARIEGAGAIAQAVVWTAVGEGTAYVLAYSPFAHDRWAADGGPTYPETVDVEVSGSPDGWGLQRLCDPVLLAAREPQHGPAVDTVTALDTQSSVLLDFTLPANRQLSELPQLHDPADKPVGVVALAHAAPRRRQVTLTVSPDVASLDGWHTLRWSATSTAAKTEQGVFLSLRPPTGESRGVVQAVKWVATLSGGAAVPEADFVAALPASIPLGWVGPTLLPVGVLLLLSPVARVWSPLPRRRRDTTRSPDDPDGDADLQAALDASGMEMGSPVAQRPAGRVLQLRVMRPGDPPTAARKTDWGYFLDDVVSVLGSPLMPKVMETPRLEALSILTLLDLHAGATARDNGGYADRARAMARIATVNGLVAAHRSGSHVVLPVQGSPTRDYGGIGSDEVGAVVARLAAGRNHGPVQVPELVSGEAVVLITDPGSDIDAMVTTLARRAAEDRCPLAIVLLIHPEQPRETGLMRVPGVPFLVDRANVEPAAVEAFLTARIEHIAGLVAVADARVVSIRTNQPIAEVVSILMNDIWESA